MKSKDSRIIIGNKDKTDWASSGCSGARWYESRALRLKESELAHDALPLDRHIKRTGNSSCASHQ